MRDEADFAAYLAARWPSLVRTLVLLGSARPEAEEVAREGMARCHGSWGQVRKVDDVDAHVYGTVLDCWRRHRRRHPVPSDATVVPDGTVAPDEGEDLPDEVLLCRALEGQLAALLPEEREVLVLRFVAELTESQVAEVLDVPVGAVTSRLPEALDRLDLAALRAVSGR